MDEPALIEALDSGQIRAFGADVLYDETPDLANHPLVGRDNVIITPHSAFYSSSSLRDLMIFRATTSDTSSRAKRTSSSSWLTTFLS